MRFFATILKKGEKETWTLSPAYDLTFANAMGEHTTDFGGRTPGKPTRKRIMEICKDYKYLKAEEYIEQTLAALADWKTVFTRLNVPHKPGSRFLMYWRSCSRISRSNLRTGGSIVRSVADAETEIPGH
ncbi:hypothetical protein [Pseudomonas hamedanensis]|uniref:hypothetical protein n=1 Tax=Pseudomonas hamedanensis TaxID=2745504 RepID=UPI001CECF1D0|nr:hypothetical protein [Pseudomonas hamedanensis]